MTNQAIRGHDWSGGVGSYDMSPGRGNEVVPPFVPDPPKGQRDEMSNGAVWNGDLPAPQPVSYVPTPFGRAPVLGPVVHYPVPHPVQLLPQDPQPPS
jgi:hypothetical protein